jgi:hypothetical protein
MPERSLSLLRGRIDREERFQAPQQGRGDPPRLPARDAPQHGAQLIAQLDAIVAQIQSRPAGQRDPEATRELVAFRPESDAELAARSLADSPSDARLVTKDDRTGIVLVDVPSAEMGYLRRKLDRYIQEPAEGTSRKHERAIAPLAAVGIATGNDRAGLRIRNARLGMDERRWLELACRGGERVETADTESSRRQILRALERLGAGSPREFLATERLVFFVRLTLRELREVIESTDCVYEFDLATPDVRGWLMVNDPDFPVRELREFEWTPPHEDAPSVVTLDTGAVSGHPLLQRALLSTHCVVPGDDSPEDEHGHGTMMAGVALYDDVAEAAERNRAEGTHWLQSVKLIRADNVGSASEENRQFWPALTKDAIEAAEALDTRPRVFALAVTADLDDPRAPTWWSHAVDRLAYAGGRGRLICISIGNVDEVNPAFVQGYPQLNLDHRLDDPAHAANALTVGAYTEKTQIPPDRLYGAARCVAPAGGVAPCTRSGLLPADGDAIKPDVVFEGGNYVEDGGLVATDLDTLATVTTGRNFLRSPLVTHRDTSLATANAARFAARVWAANPDLRPETVRGLIVHSASWTPGMEAQLPNLDERLSLCGYGAPDLTLATSCALERATVIVEDRISGAVREESGDGSRDKRRVAKFFQLPVPEGLLLEAGHTDLRVTLSYFPEPNTFGRRQYRGLNLGWDMQGPLETEAEFRQRVNLLQRDSGYRERARTASFPWRVGKRRRGRGTVQSDRWSGEGALLDGEKWIAVYPVLGWWERRRLEYLEMPFSLIVTIRATSGVDVYTPIRIALSPEVEIPGT